MTDYKQLYEQMKEKQTTTFAMLMKVMEENEKLKSDAEYDKDEIKILKKEWEEFDDLVRFQVGRAVKLEKKIAELEKEKEELNEELQETIIEAEKYEAERDELRWNVEGLEEMLDA